MKAAQLCLTPGQNTGVGSLCLLQRNLPDPGIELGSPAYQADSLAAELTGKPMIVSVQFSSVQFSHSVVSFSLQPHGLQHARFPCPSPTPGAYSNSYPSRWWCYPTISSCHLLLLLPSIFPSIRVFSNESVLRIRWPKYSSFSFGISPPNEYSGLISFRVDWLNLLVVRGTLKSLLQHHSSKAKNNAIIICFWYM